MKISLIEENRKRTVQNDVICKIRDLVNTRNLEFGDKLPSERFMSEKFEVNRNQIREAIRRLEFFGVLKSKAQSGTILNVGLIGFNAIINEIVSLDIPTFKQLVETRITIELKTVCLAAERRSEEDLQKIHSALHSLKLKLISGEDHLEDDLLFHIEIAKASKNNALLTFMLLITPSILAIYDKDIVCEGDKVTSEIKKHEDVYLAIKSKNVKLAKKMIKEHFVKLSQHLEGV